MAGLTKIENMGHLKQYCNKIIAYSIGTEGHEKETGYAYLMKSPAAEEYILHLYAGSRPDNPYIILHKNTFPQCDVRIGWPTLEELKHIERFLSSKKTGECVFGHLTSLYIRPLINNQIYATAGQGLTPDTTHQQRLQQENHSRLVSRL